METRAVMRRRPTQLSVCLSKPKNRNLGTAPWLGNCQEIHLTAVTPARQPCHCHKHSTSCRLPPAQHGSAWWKLLAWSNYKQEKEWINRFRNLLKYNSCEEKHLTFDHHCILNSTCIQQAILLYISFFVIIYLFYFFISPSVHRMARWLQQMVTKVCTCCVKKFKQYVGNKAGEHGMDGLF